MEQYEVSLSAQADEDICTVIRYFAVELRNPQAADGPLGQFAATIQSLQKKPERFALVSDEYLLRSASGWPRLDTTCFFILWTSRMAKSESSASYTNAEIGNGSCKKTDVSVPGRAVPSVSLRDLPDIVPSAKRTSNTVPGTTSQSISRVPIQITHTAGQGVLLVLLRPG